MAILKFLVELAGFEPASRSPDIFKYIYMFRSIFRAKFIDYIEIDQPLNRVAF